MIEVDKKYRRQPIENLDADLSYINLSFFENLPFIKVLRFSFFNWSFYNSIFAPTI
jgi:hypothetical protein